MDRNDLPPTWLESGYALLPQFFIPSDHCAIRSFVAEIIDWPEQPGKWMKYFEPGVRGDEKVPCRIENFFDYHQKLTSLVIPDRLKAILQTMMGEPAVLFKEKINFKFPGGKGFKAHQDAPAFSSFGQKYHITVLVPIDPFTVTNGCLEVVEGRNRDLLPQLNGEIHPNSEQELDWQPLPCGMGDVLLFDSYLPHRSHKNNTDMPRRGLYITFNRESEGNHRSDYYELKRQEFPPDCERLAGVTYSTSVFNIANPIT